VKKFLDDDEVAIQGVYMWTRDWLAYAVSGVLFAIVVGVAILLGVEQWPVRIMIGLIGAYPAMNALTSYRAFVQTDKRYLLCEASRYRSVATKLLPDPNITTITPTGGTMLATEWEIDGVVYTVSKSYERQIQAIGMIVAEEQYLAEKNA